MIKGPKKTVSVMLPEELYEKLRMRAKETNRSVSAYIRQVLKGREPPIDGPSGGVVPGKAE